MKRIFALIVAAGIGLILPGCGRPETVTEAPSEVSVTEAPPTVTEVPTEVAEIESPRSFETGEYRNLFKELLGKSDAEIQEKLDAAWQHFFYGDDDFERVYYPVGDDMAYMLDVGNGDVRSEGMSYGMMIAVQMDKQEEFNRLWTWAMTHMYHTDGPYSGYFSWHNTIEGEALDANPASDGEEWFVMALFFAAGRWGNGEGIYDYEAQANAILNTMLHKSEEEGIATDMFDEETGLIVFVPTLGQVSAFSDPSYHLPHYYELWARWADEDNETWRAATEQSRAFLKTTVHPETGLMPDYANFDGTPRGFGADDHTVFRFDAWRTTMNIAVDYAWFGADPWAVEQSNRILDFFYEEGIGSYGNQYTLDGQPLSGDRSSGLVAMNAVGALAATTEHRAEFVEQLWQIEPPSGRWRYYDGLLYTLALLHASGEFKIYAP
jgi:oligosaccharide reducing-end xylanase